MAGGKTFGVYQELNMGTNGRTMVKVRVIAHPDVIESVAYALEGLRCVHRAEGSDREKADG